MKLQKAFSLIELSVVVLIIGVVTLVALNGKSLLIKASCVASTLGSKSINDNLDNPSALTKNKNTAYENCLKQICDTSSLNLVDLPITSGLILQLDAADTCTLFTDSSCTKNVKNGNDNVFCWKDKSGNNNNAKASPSIANKPIFLSNDINQRAVINLPNSGMDYDNPAFLSSSSSASFVVVIKRTSGTNNGNFLDTLFSAWPHWYTGGGLYQAFGYSSRQYLGVNPSSLNVPIIHSTVADSTSGLTTVYFNGSQFDQRAFGGAFLNGSYSIGAAQRAGYYFEGSLAEILVYNKALTLSERKQIECYMGSKWGIAVSGC